MSFLVRYETELAMQTAAFFDEPPVQPAIVPTIGRVSERHYFFFVHMP